MAYTSTLTLTQHTHTCTLGIRGEIRVRVKVEMMKDQVCFKQSSCVLYMWETTN